jgi:hypothetical protein
VAQPKSHHAIPVCSVATERSLKEFLLLKFSLEQYHEVQWFVSTDTIAHNALKEFKNVTSLQLVKSDRGSHGVEDEEKNQVFLNMIMTKFDALEAALDSFGYGLFVDADIFFTNPIEEKFLKFMLDPKVDAIVSPHMTHNFANEAKVGHFNVGFFVMRNRRYFDLHREMSLRHKELGMFYEQQPLQFSSYEFFTLNAPINYNIGWWRFNETYTEVRLDWLRLENQSLYLNRSPAVCFHAHTLMQLEYQNYGAFLVDKVLGLLGHSAKREYHDFLLELKRLASE